METKTGAPAAIPETAGAATDKLATRGPMSMANIPDDLVKDAGRGTEKIGQDDVRPPRLKITQSGSPQRKPDNDKQIAGLQELDMFNDLTGEIYGRGPLNIIVIAQLGARGMQFAGDGKTVLDFDVKLDDPRMQFTTDKDGKRVKPVASKFYDYLLWLPDQTELVALSLSSTMLPVAVKLNGLLKSPLKIDGSILMNPPAWARTYSLETKMKQDANFAWGIFNLKTVGLTPPDVRAGCSELANTYSKARIIIDHDEIDAAESGVTGQGAAPASGGGEPSDM